MGRLGRMGFSQITFVGCWQNRFMYIQMDCSKHYCHRVKYYFGQQEIVFLGYVVTNNVGGQTCGNGLWSKKGFMSLFGIANNYHHVIWNFLKVARTLSNLFKRILSQTLDKPYHKSFGELKIKLVLPHVLKFAEFDRPFEVHTETNDFAILRVNAWWMAMVYDSKKFNSC